MKKIKIVLISLGIFLASFSITLAAINIVPNGGTGVGTITGIIKGNGTAPFSAIVSGTDIKTINSTSILGSGNIVTPQGTVTSVTGTSNRITSSGGATPAIDIAATYVGQSSITTLGTITTGVWTGTAIANANLANSTISGVALGASLNALTATNGSLTFSGSYDGSAARTVGLNVANANTWTGKQTFNTSAPRFGTITGGDQCLHVDTNGDVSGTGSDCGSGSGGATVALDNLASVAINTSLISDTNNTDDLGSDAIEWKDIYIDGTAYLDAIDLAGTGITSTGTQLNYLSSATGTTGTTSTNLVFSTSPALTTPSLGAATALSINKVALTAPASGSTLTIADGKTLTANSSLTLAGADSKTLTILKTMSLTSADDTGVYTLPTGTKTLLATDGSGTSLTGIPYTITGTANQVIASAGTGNITLSLPQSIATSSSPQFAGLELSHATQNTLTASGGILSIEGVAIPTISSSDTLTNKTLTSPNLTTPVLGAATYTTLSGGAITNSALTSGRVTFASTAGLMADDADLTFSGDTLTATKVGATTLAGTATLAENSSIALDPAGSADGKYSGTTVAGTAGATLAFGDLVYLDPTDSRWELADANSAAAADGDARGILGIVVLAAAADGSATTVLLQGIVRADAAFPALTINAQLYVSETAGDIVVAQPTTTDVVIKVIGVGITADEIYFNPSMDYITHT